MDKPKSTKDHIKCVRLETPEERFNRYKKQLEAIEAVKKQLRDRFKELQSDSLR